MASTHLFEARIPPRGRRGPRPFTIETNGLEPAPPGGLSRPRVDIGIAALLDPGSIAPRIAAAGKRQVLAVIAEMAARNFGLRAPAVFDALLEREAIASTGIGKGVAAPHAKLEGLPGVKGLFVRLSAPIEFEAVDDQPVDLVFALLAPPHGGSEHLRALARIARLLRDRDLRQQLRAAPGVAALRALLTSENPLSAF